MNDHQISLRHDVNCVSEKKKLPLLIVASLLSCNSIPALFTSLGTYLKALVDGVVERLTFQLALEYGAPNSPAIIVHESQRRCKWLERRSG
ncbi:MAG: hypothetical protein PVH65_16635, partial [Chloroflexota bacterium]